MKPDIVRRYAHNPILTKADIPYPVETVHNAGVAKHEDEYIMLFRSHLRTGRSIIGLARSPDMVSILLGNGDGTFQSHVDYATGTKPSSVTSGDFNGDKTLDLAV